MKIPKTLMMGGHEIAVEKVDNDAINAAGDWAAWAHRIRINTEGTTEDKQAEVFLHEILEAIKYLSGMKLSHQNLTVFSEMLFGVIRQNKLTFLKDE